MRAHVLLALFAPAHGFVTPSHGFATPSHGFATPSHGLAASRLPRPRPTVALAEKRGVLGRFTAPVIDDPALPLSALVIAGAATPALLASFVLVLGAPRPSWLASPLGVVGATLVHGAKLASCWLGGALAARAFEADAFEGTRDSAGAWEPDGS